jgi:hypothetical protein
MTDGDWVEVAIRAGVAVIVEIVRAIQLGDVKALDALAQVIDRPEVLAARDAALIESQRKLAEAALGKGGSA